VDGGPESAGFIDCNGGAGRQRLGRDQLRRHCARRGGSLRGAAHGLAPESLVEALGVGCCGKTEQQIAYPNGAKSNDPSCYGRRACCWLEAMACASSWRGGLQTRELQVALAANAFKTCAGAGVGQISGGASISVIGKEQADLVGSRNHPMKSYASQEPTCSPLKLL
jgi:hypothetical protein